MYTVAEKKAHYKRGLCLLKEIPESIMKDLVYNNSLYRNEHALRGMYDSATKKQRELVERLCEITNRYEDEWFLMSIPKLRKKIKEEEKRYEEGEQLELF